MQHLLTRAISMAAVCALAPSGFALRSSPNEGGGDGAQAGAGGPRRELSGVELERWDAGRAFFQRAMTEADGLGPAFNATSCGACHSAPAPGGAGGIESNVRLAAGEGQGADAVSRYLSQHQVSCRPGPEDLQRLLEQLKDDPERRAAFVAGTVQTPSILGLGLLERVHEDEILGREDPEDRDGDGVRGVAKRVTVGGAVLVGRFGWRADLPTLNDFARAACGGELGLTVPAEVGFGRTTDGDLASDPEMTWSELDALVFFCRELAPPARGGRAQEPEVQRGEQVFRAAGCATCHVPALYGADGPVHAYTDLLLHAVVPAGTRQLVRGTSPPPEDREPALFRTPPLWGVGATAPYLHDGRAATLTEAIQAHAGEAEGAHRRFDGLRPEGREALLAFLADL
jgi:CxxC motif-containing protein (DUF1111 family)